MPSRFDVKRVVLHQYRSIAACDVKLGPLTMLVGPNGSGKSNFLDALRLMAQALSENLDNAIRERGGIAEVRRRSRGRPHDFSIEVACQDKDYVAEYSFRIAAAARGEYRVSHEKLRVFRLSDAHPEYYEVRNGKLVDTSQPVMPLAAPDRLYLVAASGIDVFRPVFDGLAAFNV